MIQVQQTPNPLSVKFVLPEPIQIDFVPSRSFFVKGEGTVGSPFAEQAFSIEGVQGVFIGKDFITITKASQANWDALIPQIIACIEKCEHFFAPTKPIVNHLPDHNDLEVVNKIEELIAAKVRPVIQQDGGDIVFEKFYDGIVFVKLQGACLGCPSSRITLKMGIEKILKQNIPEVKSVEQVA